MELKAARASNSSRNKMLLIGGFGVEILVKASVSSSPIVKKSKPASLYMKSTANLLALNVKESSSRLVPTMTVSRRSNIVEVYGGISLDRSGRETEAEVWPSEALASF